MNEDDVVEKIRKKYEAGDDDFSRHHIAVLLNRILRMERAQTYRFPYVGMGGVGWHRIGTGVYLIGIEMGHHDYFDSPAIAY